MVYFGDSVSSKFSVNNIKDYLKERLRLRKFKNLVEALSVSKIIRKLSGIIVLELINTEEGIVTKFSPTGFIFFLLWNSLYFYYAYKSHVEDQTIIRHMHNTRVQRYGDVCEGIISLAYVIFAIWKIPFQISKNSTIIKIIINADKTLENLGEKVDYNRDAQSASAISVGQAIVHFIRLISIWLILKNLNVEIPLERMYTNVYFNTLALIVTAYFCYFLSVLRNRFHYTNKILQDISTRKSWEYKIFGRGILPSNIQKVESLQDKYISQKIKSCAKIYGLLHQVVVAINDMFGMALAMTMLICIIYIIFYIFYFLEATTAGLFHDMPKFIYFSIYIFWQMVYALGIIYLIVYFCECVMREGRKASCIVHEIIVNESNPLVNTEAMHLSLQLLHQRPIFTANGLYQIKYSLFEQGACAISSYLVVLLQFVVDANLN